ncbi:hypothetical protein [Sphingomonas jatrophae]|uniref:Uncharacterized protein n=1 Tax=Sphingomonas jatrophae TaxID=1166337 RepID=A0A1I6K7M5_9SPHN|nr:hypothetical protein [Sphingomonas jatrophae]SFR87154.1 hypothetical protein SAMN05192580_1410 [Sphingomonas jatrophae]
MSGLAHRRAARSPDAHRLLIRAIGEYLPDATFAATQSIPWASATFTGARHRLDLVLPSIEAATAFAAKAAELDLPLRGHIVADLVATAGADGCLTVEALTIEDA